MSLPRRPPRHVVLVTGSQEWIDEARMRERLRRYPPGTLLIHGDAKGADKMAAAIGRELEFRTLAEPYFWDLGRAGGPRRNELLVDLGCCYARHGYDVCVEAFPLAGCRGTLDCIARARRARLRVELDAQQRGVA